ncbi:MAG: biotin carboxylase N-terminal domain-containing protein [Saprospiraceae bacterium]
MKKILIANRGEIAVRIIKTLNKMNIETIAVYSDADRHSPHVRLADEAYNIGPATSSESYLNQDKIIEVALKCGAEGIHPGYGFLSENSSFAQKAKDVGIVFIGPSPEAIKIMGNKIEAKKAVSKFNVPMAPGSGKSMDNIDEAIEIADKIECPCFSKSISRRWWKRYASSIF